MKYVVHRHGNILVPTVFPECWVHSMVIAEKATVRSAGFFTLDHHGRVRLDTKRKSESLGVGPCIEGDFSDLELLTSMFSDINAMAFVLMPGDDGYVEPDITPEARYFEVLVDSRVVCLTSSVEDDENQELAHVASEMLSRTQNGPVFGEINKKDFDRYGDRPWTKPKSKKRYTLKINHILEPL